MKKYLIIPIFASLGLVLFNACQGDAEHGLDDQCVIALQFDVLKTPCEGAVATFDLFFIDQDGNQYTFPFELPADQDETQLIALPSGNTYGGWVRGDGGLSFTCDPPGPFYFNISVIHPETGEICADMITSVDGRPDTVNENDPYISFTLPETCDGCPDIDEPEDECIIENCGGTLSGFYGSSGYYTYPLEELSVCEGMCIKVLGDPFGVPNHFTIFADGQAISSEWVGDGDTYTQGPWQGSPIPLTYEFEFEAQQDVTYTLQVETVAPQGETDTWSAEIFCNDCTM